MADRRKRKSDAARQANQVIRSRTVLVMLLFGVATFAILFLKLYDLQILRHEDLQEKAVAQQTRSTVVTASRGTIYDCNGHVLAISATAETVCIAPKEILENKEDEGYIARGLSRILGVDEDVILKKMKRTGSQYEEIKKKADQDMADQVRKFINGQIDDEGNAVAEDQQKKLQGIFLNADSKRYYPYHALAAQVIGFVGTDNTGLYGLEAQYENELEGTSGLTVTAKTNTGEDMLYQYEQYYDAKNGDSLKTTLDTNVQYYLENGVEAMADKFDAKNGATGIVMNVNTGAILGMASYPTYDLDDPFTIYDQKLAASTQAALASLEKGSDAYKKAAGDAQLRQWRNKCINDTYEPGSTFKPITLATALEEGVVNMNTTFYCSGSIRVPGWSKPINCSNHRGHGSETLKVATGNSCNPAFITMGLKTGTATFYKYLRAFGLMEHTGIDEQGEADSIFATEKDFGTNVVSLASYAFGQTFNVTPLQLIRAQAACVNGGYLYTPYLVSEVVGDDGSVVYQHDTTPVRQVISSETSSKVRECLEYVVASGTGKNGQVAGYRIGGKTGTADKTGNKDREIVVSFMCFAPADDPQIIMLLTLDTPSRTTGTYPSGGQMVAPTASAIMTEILPYLGIQQEAGSDTSATADATVPNCVGSTLAEAKAKLEAKGFACKAVGSGAAVTDQTPVGGSIIPGGSTVILYLGGKKPDAKCTVPDVIGKTASAANQAVTNAGLIMKVTGTTAASSGNVYAISQDHAAGEQVEAGTVITVRFGDNSVLD
ncbi:MAG: PASTA domain-containing protein [Oscillibacter sp.]|jgi:stage V sporulation protein D (sporulation-specific penicillin-binding protein)|nr:PASTA domain-containing protein [Oscillibacter sp.]